MSDGLRSPIQYSGGKGRNAKWIVPILESIPHTRFVETHGGGYSITLAKKPVAVETYNDINHALYEFFTMLANPRLFKKFYRRVIALPVSRQLYRECRESWESEPDMITRAAKWFVVTRQSFGGDFGHSWSHVRTASSRGMARTCSGWLSILDMLPDIHVRLQRVQIECDDFRTIIKNYDTPDTLFYLDPPYVPDTRKSGGYAYEMTAEDHQEMVKMLLSIEGKAALSGYPTPLYGPLEAAGWTRIDRHTACDAAGRTRGSGLTGNGILLAKQPRTECLWLKPYGVKQNGGLL